jgi:hypothetical protein
MTQRYLVRLTVDREWFHTRQRLLLEHMAVNEANHRKRDNRPLMTELGRHNQIAHFISHPLLVLIDARDDDHAREQAIERVQTKYPAFDGHGDCWSVLEIVADEEYEDGLEE